MIDNERGLSLVEILVAIAIIGIGLVGLAVVVPVASYGVQEGNQLSTATFLAEQRLEEVRNAPWAASPANDCLGVSSNNAPPGSTTCTRSAPTSCTGGTACTTYGDESAVAGFTGYSGLFQDIGHGFQRQLRRVHGHPFLGSACSSFTF